MAVDNKPYKILVTGVSISGKTSLSKHIERDLTKLSLFVTNKDVDWDEDALIVPQDSNIYLLQTPKGCTTEEEHRIAPVEFDKILYSDPNIQTYHEFLTSRGCAWFKEGVVEKGLDTNPEPYSNEKLPDIIKRILNYESARERLRNEDIIYFNSPKLRHKLRVLRPEITRQGKLFFKNYTKTLEEIIGEVINI